MNQETDLLNDDEMRPKYDFSAGVRDKYYQVYQSASNVVVLDPDVAEIFKDSAAMNEALRMLAKIAQSLLTER